MTDSEPAERSPELDVIAIVADQDAIALMDRTLRRSGDRLSVATDLADGLARASAEAPDLVFVDVSLGKNAGLAVVHHVRALVPGVSVFALARAENLAFGTQAIALGGAGILMLPLSGDELLNAIADVRTRRAERDAKGARERQIAAERKGAALITRMAEIAESTQRKQAAERLAGALVELSGVTRAAVYLPAGEGSRQLLLAGQAGEPCELPSFCEDMQILTLASELGLSVERLTLRHENPGLILVGQNGVSGPTPFFEAALKQAALAFALIGERERAHRGAMKDPRSSAYTFAYFVDVAGREIDKARRHNRRFALATIGVEDREGRAFEGREPTVEVAERVLAAVRDTDVLSRVDSTEFYLLLPETGGMGAHACRRRVMRELTQVATDHASLDVRMGVATFPHDGRDLSQLLRVAKYRAEASTHSLAQRLELAKVPLHELLEHLLAGSREDAARERERSGLKAIELAATDVMGFAACAVSEVVRGGSTRVVAAQRSGVSLGAAARSVLDRDAREVKFDGVDLSQIPECSNAEVLIVIGEHGTYLLCGRAHANGIQAAHSDDPLLADLLLTRLGEAAGVRLLD